MFLKLLVIALLLSGAISLHMKPNKHNYTKTPSPLIIVPGDGGSRSYANINYHVVTVKRLVWVNFEYMLFPGELTNIFKLIYDPITHTTKDAPLSTVMFPGWGSTEMIEDLDEWKHQQTTYFAPMVQELMKDKYYQRNRTLRGAPYDFRKAPNENVFFVNDLKVLVEETYKMAGNERVVLLGHSLGSLYSLYFLDKMPLSWKKQYVRTFISVSAPLGGAVKALKLILTGDALGSPRNPFYFREMQRSFPSTAFLLPKAATYGEKPIIITPKKNYSANDFESLFKILDFSIGAMMYNDTKDLVDGSKSPEGIDELLCLHGYGLKTDEQLVFSNFPDSEPQPISGNGDATVNVQSLELCKKWTGVDYYPIEGADHMAIVGHGKFVTKLKQVLYQQPTTKYTTSEDYDLPKDKFIMRVF